MSRLNVSLLGDSLSTRFTVSSYGKMLRVMRGDLRGSWFVDPTGGVVTACEALRREGYQVQANLYASPRARVAPKNRSALGDLFTRTHHLDQQVTSLLESFTNCPQLVIVWIGHNDCDWVSDTGRESLEPEQLKILVEVFTRSYVTQIERILEAAGTTSESFGLILLGLVNFRSFFVAREECERLKAMDPSLFPFLERGYRFFRSLEPQFRLGILSVADSFNESIRTIATRLSTKAVRFSDAMSRVDIGASSFLSSEDGWHPSAAGHQVLAKYAANDIIWYASSLKLLSR